MCRMLRGGGSRGIILDIVLASSLLVLTFIFLKRHALFDMAQSKTEYYHPEHYEKTSDSAIQNLYPQSGADAPAGSQSTLSNGNIIEARIKQIGEVRSDKCIGMAYDVKESVTVIIDFNDYQFYNLKSTISSVINAKMDHIAEIIIVDDGSTLKYIKEECDAFVKSIPNARLFRHPAQLGQLKSRLNAFSRAKSDIVVFLDVNVVCSKGWLEPLIDLLVRQPMTIAIPHHDLIHDPVTIEYRRIDSNYVASWTWNLAIKVKSVKDYRITSDTQFVLSPAIRGSAFAVRKRLFENLGRLDEFFEDGGGEYLDLSLKAWLCDAAIMIATCSRIGVVNLNNPVKIRSRRNMRYIIEKYLGDHKEAALKLNKITGHKGSVLQGKAATLPDMGKCKDIEWYLKNIKNETNGGPSTDVLHFGVLKVHSGRCVQIGNDSKLDLQICNNDPNELPMEMTNTGYIRTADGRCLVTNATAYILAERCRANDKHQEWQYTSKGELINVWSGYCARHVTDPDPNKPGRQIAMAQMCTGEPSKNDPFKQWSFLTS